MLREKLANAISKAVMGKLAEVLYHGSGEKVKTLKPLNQHGDPDVDKVIFASPSKEFALCYSGRKWSDADINQSGYGNGKDRKFVLTEMRPGALEDIYGGASGYLYEVPKKPFHEISTRSSNLELISESEVKPLRTTYIPDVLSEMKQSNNIELVKYDPGSKEYKNTLARMQARVDRFSPHERDRYLGWIEKNNPELAKKILPKKGSDQA